MIGATCRFLSDYHMALLAICAHTYFASAVTLDGEV